MTTTTKTPTAAHAVTEFVVIPTQHESEPIMMPLLIPPADDPRTPEEYTYDMQRSGMLYSVPTATSLCTPPAIPSVLEQIAIEPDDVDEVYILPYLWVVNW